MVRETSQKVEKMAEEGVLGRSKGDDSVRVLLAEWSGKMLQKTHIQESARCPVLQ